MHELLSTYQALSPLAVGMLFFVLGLAFGSFSSVLYYRIPRGESVIHPRSHCPACGHTLGVRELLPILSFIWQRGKCRSCKAPIPVRYMLLELGSGAMALVAGMLGGWGAGAAALATWVVGAAVLGIVAKRGQTAEAGFTLVEALIALLFISMALAPALDTIAVARQAGLAGQRRSLALGLARARISQLTQVAQSGIGMVDSMTCAEAATDLTPCTVEWQTDASVPDTYLISAQRLQEDLTAIRKVKVSVTCPSCKARYGKAVPEVTLQAVIRGG